VPASWVSPVARGRPRDPSRLAVAWTGGESGAQAFLAFQTFGNAARVISCTFDAAAGQGEVSFSQQFSTQFTAGGYPVQLTAVSSDQASATFQ
jgi:hypothetical protein